MNHVLQIPITKYQQWDSTVMAAIWEKRGTLDPGQLANIKALYDNAKQHNRLNISTYTYFYSKNSSISKAGYGRLYAVEKGSLERIEKTLRHSLCAKMYWDVDMVNAQPTILYQIAKKRGLNLSLLSKYVSHREIIIAQFMKTHNATRDEIKEWFIKCIFGAVIPELHELQNELRQLANELRNEYTDLYDKIIKMKESNIIGTFLAYVAQTEECKCLLSMNDFLTKHGREVGVMCYDGCLVYKLDKECNFPSDLLRLCEQYIYDMSGYEIQLVVKEMKCSPDFSTPSKLLRKSDIDDVYMTRKFISSMNNSIINDVNNGLIVYDKTTGYWSNDQDVLRTAIINANLVEETIEGTVNYSGYINKQDIIMKQLPALIPTTNFCEMSIDKTIGKLLFRNGIYDMATRTFTKGFDPALYFGGRIMRDFPERNPTNIEIVNKILFEDPFKQNEQESGIYLKELLARAIAGHYNDKVMIWAVGETNSGKGAQSTALYNCFDSFVSSYNPNALLYNKNSGTDEAKKLSWVYPIHNSRISIGNEVRPNGIIDTSILKSLVSGGDLIPIRKNFKDEEYKINRATLLYFCNDIAKFNADDNATLNRIKLYEYKLSFVENPSESWERPSIQNLKTLFQQDEYKDAYFWCIVDAYKNSIPIPPKCVIESAREWIPAPKQSFKGCLQDEGYKIVTDPDAFIPFNELKGVLLENGIGQGLTDNALGRELSKLGLEPISKFLHGKSIKCRRFIQKM